LHYHDAFRVLDFTGADIRAVDVPDVGTLVSVTIFLTVDSGSTTFTVLLPLVNLPAPPLLPASVSVTTEGITTVHHFSIFITDGQQEFYTVTKLTGTASWETRARTGPRFSPLMTITGMLVAASTPAGTSK
jgi:hypothetical protein